jgi:RNA polymerase sigma-70 factor (ECF subfamily)
MDRGGSGHDRSMTARAPSRDDAQGDAADAGTEFDAVYRANVQEVRRWVGYLGGAPSDADDLTQRVFEVVLRRLPGFDGRNLRAWLYGITRRTVAAHRRLAWVRRRFAHDEDAPERFASAEPGAEGALARKRTVERVLSGMSEKLRTALILHEVEGWTAEEIAELLGVPVATVHSRLRLARERYLAIVRQLGPEEDL